MFPPTTGCSNCPVWDPGPWGSLCYCQSFHDCWPTQWTHWTPGEDRPGQLCFQRTQVISSFRNIWAMTEYKMISINDLRELNICFSIICVPGTCRTSWFWQPSKLTALVSWSTSTASTTMTPQTSLTSPLAMSSSRRLLRSSGSLMWTHQQCRCILSLKYHLNIFYMNV